MPDIGQTRRLGGEFLILGCGGEAGQMVINGACHCGNVSFTLDWLPAPNEIPARACGCSFCTKHGGVWTSTPNAALKIAVKEQASVSRYAFGTRTAEFHVCSRCGVVPVVNIAGTAVLLELLRRC